MRYVCNAMKNEKDLMTWYVMLCYVIKFKQTHLRKQKGF